MLWTVIERDFLLQMFIHSPNFLNMFWIKLREVKILLSCLLSVGEILFHFLSWRCKQEMRGNLCT